MRTVELNDRRSRSGWTLVVLVVILTSVMVAMVGMSMAMAESRRITSVRQNEARAFYLAQAGIMQGIHDFRSPSGVVLGEHVVDPGPAPGTTADDDVFILGGQPTQDVGVDMSKGKFTQPELCGQTRDRFQNWTIRNTGGTPVVIDKMTVTWQPVLSGEGVIRIDLRASGPDWSSPGCTPVASGSAIDIPNRQLGTSPPHLNVRVWFATTTMENKDVIEVTFTMTDGSQVTGRFDPKNPGASSTRYRLTSTGEARKGAYPMVNWRTIQAEYQPDDPNNPDGAGRILWYQELKTRNAP